MDTPSVTAEAHIYKACEQLLLLACFIEGLAGLP